VNKNNDIALLPRPASALEKAEPGAQRILSGMVADTLALVKKKPLRIVLVNDDECVLRVTETVIRCLFKDIEVLTFDHPREAMQELGQRSPDLLITDTQMPYMTGMEMIQRLLDKKANYPMLLTGGNDSNEKGVGELANPNVSFLRQPFTTTQLLEIVAKRLRLSPERVAEIAPQPLAARPLRIVMLDDDSMLLSVFEAAVRIWFKDAIVLTFGDAEEAMKELERENPDIFTTDWVHPKIGGSELLRLLAARKATFPVLVMSGNATEELVRKHTPPNLNVSFLPKPSSVPQLTEIIATKLGLSPERLAGIARQPRGTRPLRIVMLDDEPMTLDVLEAIIRARFRDATVLKFDDAEEALNELAREAPDVFTTDWQHSKINGREMLHLLAQRGVRYPVFVISGLAQVRDTLLRMPPKNLNVTYLRKPCTPAKLVEALEVALKIPHAPLPTKGISSPDKP